MDEIEWFRKSIEVQKDVHSSIEELVRRANRAYIELRDQSHEVALDFFQAIDRAIADRVAARIAILEQQGGLVSRIERLELYRFFMLPSDSDQELDEITKILNQKGPDSLTHCRELAERIQHLHLLKQFPVLEELETKPCYPNFTSMLEEVALACSETGTLFPMNCLSERQRFEIMSFGIEHPEEVAG
jgi:hypothetical protein